MASIMTDEQARSAFEVECAERHVDAMNAFYLKKEAELRDAESALDRARTDLEAKRVALAHIKNADGK